jgi:hypothetical protein
VRLVGFVMILLGVVATAAGALVGCSTTLAWNGRRAVDVHELVVDAPYKRTFEATRGTRYSAGVQVLFDRQGLPERDGLLVVEARMPVVASIKDASGTKVSEAVGWVEPGVPPTDLTGDAVRIDPRAQPPELIAERLVGPFSAPRHETMTVEVSLGPDRTGPSTGPSIGLTGPTRQDGDSAASDAPARPRIVKTRVVLYDDGLPRSVYLAFGVAAGGVLTAIAGAFVVMAGFFRNRRGIRPRQIV